MTAIVTASNNAPVKMRKVPNGIVLQSVQQGTEVEILEQYDDTWSKIQVGEQIGYMMTKFLKETKKEDYKELITKLKEVLKLLEKLEGG